MHVRGCSSWRDRGAASTKTQETTLSDGCAPRRLLRGAPATGTSKTMVTSVLKTPQVPLNRPAMYGARTGQQIGRVERVARRQLRRMRIYTGIDGPNELLRAGPAGGRNDAPPCTVRAPRPTGTADQAPPKGPAGMAEERTPRGLQIRAGAHPKLAQSTQLAVRVCGGGWVVRRALMYRRAWWGLVPLTSAAVKFGPLRTVAACLPLCLGRVLPALSLQPWRRWDALLPLLLQHNVAQLRMGACRGAGNAGYKCERARRARALPLHKPCCGSATAHVCCRGQQLSCPAGDRVPAATAIQPARLARALMGGPAAAHLPWCAVCRATARRPLLLLAARPSPAGCTRTPQTWGQQQAGWGGVGCGAGLEQQVRRPCSRLQNKGRTSSWDGRREVPRPAAWARAGRWHSALQWRPLPRHPPHARFTLALKLARAPASVAGKEPGWGRSAGTGAGHVEHTQRPRCWHPPTGTHRARPAWGSACRQPPLSSQDSLPPHLKSCGRALPACTAPTAPCTVHAQMPAAICDASSTPGQLVMSTTLPSPTSPPIHRLGGGGQAAGK